MATPTGTSEAFKFAAGTSASTFEAFEFAAGTPKALEFVAGIFKALVFIASIFETLKVVAGILQAQPTLLQHLPAKAPGLSSPATSRTPQGGTSSPWSHPPSFFPLLQSCPTRALKNRVSAPVPAPSSFLQGPSPGPRLASWLARLPQDRLLTFVAGIIETLRVLANLFVFLKTLDVFFKSLGFVAAPSKPLSL